MILIFPVWILLTKMELYKVLYPGMEQRNIFQSVDGNYVVAFNHKKVKYVGKFPTIEEAIAYRTQILTPLGTKIYEGVKMPGYNIRHDEKNKRYLIHYRVDGKTRKNQFGYGVLTTQKEALAKAEKKKASLIKAFGVAVE